MCRISNVIVWDIETVPDLQGFAAANGHLGKSDDEVRAELGDKVEAAAKVFKCVMRHL
jgi:hypothetical protein